MGSIKLPQVQLSELPTPRKKNSQDELILQVLGNNPWAKGIESVGTSIGDALARRNEIRRSVAEKDDERAFQKELLGIKNQFDVNEEARKQAQSIAKVRALEAQFDYKPNELGDDHPSALLKVQNDLALKRIASGPGADRATASDKNRYRNYLLDMEQRDPVIKEINKQGLSLSAVDSLSRLVNEGNTVAFSALGTKMAKGMGEVGVLTEEDVKRYVRSGAIAQKAGDTILTWLRGRPTEATLSEIGQITNVMRDAFQNKAQPRIDQYIKSYSGIEGVSPEEFASKLSLSYGGSKKSSPTNQNQKKATLRWNEQTQSLEPVR